MSPLAKRLLDVATAVALTLAVVFVVIVTNSVLTARGGYWHGFNLFLSLVQRPDIVGTMVLTALVTFGYVLWQQGGKSR